MSSDGALEKSLAEKCKYKLAATTATCRKWHDLDESL